MDGRELVAAVRAAAQAHDRVWGALVPSLEHVDFAHEEAEERAYTEAEAARQALRDHISEIYGVSARELLRLAIS